MTGSDSVGTTMGVYDTKALPLYQYLHSKGAPKYAIDDDFFQAAFGGSFLNHQWLIAAASPVFPGATAGQHTDHRLERDAHLLPALHRDRTGLAPSGHRGLRRVRSTASSCQRSAATGLSIRCSRRTSRQGHSVRVISPQTAPTIGDRLSDAGVDWAWYAGGWSNANGDVGAPGWTNGSSAAATPTGCLGPGCRPE